MELFNQRIKIRASRWPWQKGYNWRGMTSSSAPLNYGGARFGGGWRYKFGFELGGFSSRNSLGLDLLFGIISVSWDFRPEHVRQAEEKSSQEFSARMAEWRKDDERGNANLIAAAPDMLAALQGIVDCVARTETMGEICQCDDFSAARAAIAKAKGGAA